MSHVLLTGSRTLAPLMEFLEREFTLGSGWLTATLSAAEADTLNYVDTRETLASLVPSLTGGQLASVQMRREASPLLVGLYQPRFCGARLGLWTCVFEGEQEEVEELYGKLESLDGIVFAALSFDEAPELATADVSPETFPWHTWQLIRARIRSSSGQWTERAGPAA